MTARRESLAKAEMEGGQSWHTLVVLRSELSAERFNESFVVAASSILPGFHCFFSRYELHRMVYLLHGAFSFR